MKRMASSLSATIAGPLVMGTSHHIGLHRLPPVLRAFTKQYPQVHLDIRFMDSEAACRAVETGDLELAVVTLPTSPSSVLLTRPLWQDPLAFVVGTEHPLARRKTVTVAELTRHSAVLPGPATYTRAILEDALEGTGMTLTIGMSTNYLETLKMLVATGLGWSLLPASMINDEVCALPVPLNLSRELGLVTHRKRTQSNAARAMIENCLAQGDPS